jgi:Ca2+/H+ antiporter, TMEM165/GDT1 family
MRSLKEREDKNMKGRWMFRGVKFVVFVVLFLIVLSFLVMSLWNWLMPGLFGLHPITFWQALGLLLLSKILLGGFGGRRGLYLPWRGRMIERWAQMSPEEREKFREGMRSRCAAFGSRTAEPRG